MAVKGLTPQLAERGKLKIGEKGEMKTSQGGKQFAQPRKLDHFLITTLQRDAAGRLLPDAALMARLKPEGGKITEVPVRLLFDDIDLNFQTRYACYRGNRCWCSGDGEAGQRFTGENGRYQEVVCPCERQDPFYTGQDRCKILGTLQVLIEGTDRIGGVWKFRTTSWNTVNAILSSLALVKTITGGPLAGIPRHLVLSPKTVTVPTNGQNMVVFVVSLEYRGPEQELAELGYNIARRRLEQQVRMEQVEAEARRMLLPPHAEPPEEQAETGAEFYPEGAADPATNEGAGATKNVAPADGEGSSLEENRPHPDLNGNQVTMESPGITFPDLMQMVHQKGVNLITPLAIRSHKSANVLGVVEKAYLDAGKPVLEIAFPANLKEVSDGLTQEMVVKSFGEAGIEVRAVEPAQGRQDIKVTELPDQGNGFLRMEIGPDGEEPPEPPKDKRKKSKPAQTPGDGPASLF